MRVRVQVVIEPDDDANQDRHSVVHEVATIELDGDLSEDTLGLYVNVPVPADRVPEVYVLLASPPPPSTSAVAEPAALDTSEWPADVTRRALEESTAQQRGY